MTLLFLHNYMDLIDLLDRIQRFEEKLSSKIDLLDRTQGFEGELSSKLDFLDRIR